VTGIQKASYLFVFDRKRQAKRKGVGLIELVVSLSRLKRKFVSTKIKIAPEQWNQSKRLVNAKHSNHLALNVALDNIKKGIEEAELEAINHGTAFTMEMADNYFKGKTETKNFIDFYRRQAMANMDVKFVTRRDHLRTLELLEEFKSDIPFSAVNYQLVYEFGQYLSGQKLSKGTVWKHHKNMKRYINQAINFKKIKPEDYPYRTFKMSRKKPDHVYLNEKELAAVEAAVVQEVPRVDAVKQMFLFSCWTGLRFSDVSRLTKDDFIESDEGINLKLSRMYKVDRKLFLKLHLLFGGKPEQMAKKHMENELFWTIGIGNAEMNKLLKVLQEAAGLKKKLTTHVGRHTFGTLYARQTGSIFEVMKAMGLSKFETAKVYIDLSEEL
jgi:integrase